MIDVVPIINEYIGNFQQSYLQEKNVISDQTDENNNIIQKELQYGIYSDTDKNFKVPVEAASNSNTLINMHFDYTQRFYSHQAYTLRLIVKHIGAMNSVIFPFVNLMYPLAALLFLYKMAGIAQRSYDKEAREAIGLFYARAREEFGGVARGIEENDPNYEAWDKEAVASVLKQVDEANRDLEQEKEDMVSGEELSHKC